MMRSLIVVLLGSFSTLTLASEIPVLGSDEFKAQFPLEKRYVPGRIARSAEGSSTGTRGGGDGKISEAYARLDPFVRLDLRAVEYAETIEPLYLKNALSYQAYQTQLKTGWLEDLKQLDAFFAPDCRDASGQSTALIGENKPGGAICISLEWMEKTRPTTDALVEKILLVSLSQHSKQNADLQKIDSLASIRQLIDASKNSYEFLELARDYRIGWDVADPSSLAQRSYRCIKADSEKGRVQRYTANQEQLDAFAPLRTNSKNELLFRDFSGAYGKCL